jgi:hypothetical protein
MYRGLEGEEKENQPAAETLNDRKKKRKRKREAVNGGNRGGKPRSVPPSPRARSHQVREHQHRMS